MLDWITLLTLSFDTVDPSEQHLMLVLLGHLAQCIQSLNDDLSVARDQCLAVLSEDDV
jgi:hypothetical protein